jgi:hypothetical protein
MGFPLLPYLKWCSKESLLDESGKLANAMMAVFVAENLLSLRGTNDNPQLSFQHWRRRKGTSGHYSEYSKGAAHCGRGNA